MEYVTDIRFITTPFFIVFSLSFAILILRLRFKSQDFPLTTSQRWGLTLIGCLYIVNSLLMTSQFALLLILDGASVDTKVVFFKLDYTLNILSFFFILSFGLVFPRPVTKWTRLIKILALLALFWTALEVMNLLWPVGTERIILSTNNPFNSLGYVIAIYIPLFLWIPEYDKQQAPQMRMVLTLLTWGFLFDPGRKTTVAVFRAFIYHEVFNVYILEFVIVVVLYILIAKSIYHRRSNLMTSDKLNIILMISAVAIGLTQGYVRTLEPDPNFYINNLTFTTVSIFMLGAFGWLLLRPLLFAYGLLRYQSFGPKVQAQRDMRFFLAVSTGVVAFIILFFSLGPINVILGILVAVLLGLLAAVAAFRLSGGLIDRILPMSHDIKEAPLRERRNTYHMGLLTAVVNGRIEDEYDQEVLERLRTDLNISSREHELLMRGFAQEKPLSTHDQLEEAYLFYKDSTLLAQASRRHTGQGKMMVGDMVTTVSRFFSDAMARGGSVVDSIEYGDWTLVVEVTRTLGLVVMVRGKDSPEIRQAMRDVLWDIRDNYQNEIEKRMDQGAVHGGHPGIEKLLKRFLDRGLRQ